MRQKLDGLSVGRLVLLLNDVYLSLSPAVAIKVCCHKTTRSSDRQHSSASLIALRSQSYSLPKLRADLHPVIILKVLNRLNFEKFSSLFEV